MAVRSTIVKRCLWYRVKTSRGWMRVLDVLYAPDPKKPRDLVLSRDYWLMPSVELEYIQVRLVV